MMVFHFTYIIAEFANADEEGLWEELDPTEPPAPTAYSLPVTSMLGW